MISADRLLVPWRTVHSKTLNKEVQVRRLTVADLGKPIEQIWHCLVRDADGTSLLPPDVSPQQVSAEVVNELMELAMANPTQAPE
jgi:hypothetical protein